MVAYELTKLFAAVVLLARATAVQMAHEPPPNKTYKTSSKTLHEQPSALMQPKWMA
jgi:hypothetical protein